MYACAVADALHDVVGFTVNDGFVGILKNLPFRRVSLQLLFLLIGLAVGLEIDRVSEILRAGKHMGNRAAPPSVIVIASPVVRNRTTTGFGIRSRIQDMLFCDLLCYFRYAIALDAQPKYLSNHLCGFFVHEPVRFIFRVFHISVWRIRTQRLAGLPLCLEHCAYLATGVFGVKFVKNIDERSHVVFRLIGTVYAVVDSDETNVGIGKYHFRVHTDLQIIASQTAHIFLCQVGTKKILRIYKPFIDGQRWTTTRERLAFSLCSFAVLCATFLIRRLKRLHHRSKAHKVVTGLSMV